MLWLIRLKPWIRTFTVMHTCLSQLTWMLGMEIGCPTTIVLHLPTGKQVYPVHRFKLTNVRQGRFTDLFKSCIFSFTGRSIVPKRELGKNSCSGAIQKEKSQSSSRYVWITWAFLVNGVSLAWSRKWSSFMLLKQAIIYSWDFFQAMHLRVEITFVNLL